MTNTPTIRQYDYVNRPYEVVARALREDPVRVFHVATKAATARAASLASELHIDVGGLKVATDVAIVVKEIVEQPASVDQPQATILRLEWQAATKPFLFPVMRGELAVYPLTSTETQLDFSGVYEPPFGIVGSALDALAGRRIAERTVHQFVSEVAAYLRSR